MGLRVRYSEGLEVGWDQGEAFRLLKVMWMRDEKSLLCPACKKRWIQVVYGQGKWIRGFECGGCGVLVEGPAFLDGKLPVRVAQNVERMGKGLKFNRKRHSSRRLTAEERVWLMRDIVYELGKMSKKEIAKKHGVDQGLITRYARMAENKAWLRRYTNEEVELPSMGVDQEASRCGGRAGSEGLADVDEGGAVSGSVVEVEVGAFG